MTSIVPSSTPQVYTALSSPVNCLVEKQDKKNLQYTIDNTPEFSTFSRILKKSGIELFNDEYKYTIFVTPNKYINDLDLSYVDKLTARTIVFSSTLHNKIPSELLLSSKFGYYSTLNPTHNLLINISNNKILLNSDSQFYTEVIKRDIICTNGIIHVVNGLPGCYTI